MSVAAHEPRLRRAAGRFAACCAGHGARSGCCDRLPFLLLTVLAP